MLNSPFYIRPIAQSLSSVNSLFFLQIFIEIQLNLSAREVEFAKNLQRKLHVFKQSKSRKISIIHPSKERKFSYVLDLQPYHELNYASA
jgi:hypothetical protein